jgi:hypothetical protein
VPDPNSDLEHVQLVIHASSVVGYPLEPAYVRDVNNLDLPAPVFLRPAVLALYVAAACLLQILVSLLFLLATDENKAIQHNLGLAAHLVISLLRRYAQQYHKVVRNCPSNMAQH